MNVVQSYFVIGALYAPARCVVKWFRRRYAAPSALDPIPRPPTIYTSRADRITSEVGLPAVLVILGALFWPLVMLLDFGDWRRARRNVPVAFEEPPEFAVRRQDLRAQVDIEEIERRERVNDPLGAVPDLPFGHLHRVWLAFLAKVWPGDAVWTFETRWDDGLGLPEFRAGYVIVRGEHIGAYMMTRREFLEREDSKAGHRS